MKQRRDDDDDAWVSDETQDEEDVQELSPSQFKQSLKQKQQKTPPRQKNTNYSAIVRRSPNDDGKDDFCV